ncbi:hypothetical protein JD969_11045 [Planctomycetota bacterium]|nr:hypothetical protein JD969_11045 [Planctomycetota bacterium]
MVYLYIDKILILIAGGMLLLLVGLRGRRVDDHVLCGACGYDLSGCKVEMNDAEKRAGQQCPECGKWFTKKQREVKVGNHVKRTWMIWCGSVMVGCGLLFGAYVVNGVQLRQWKSNGVLIWEMSHPGVSVNSGQVGAELVARMWRGDLNADELEELKEIVFVDGLEDEGGVWKQGMRILFDALWESTLTAEEMESAAERILVRAEREEMLWESCWADLLMGLHEKGRLSEGQKRRWVEIMAKDWEVVLVTGREEVRIERVGELWVVEGDPGLVMIDFGWTGVNFTHGWNAGNMKLRFVEMEVRVKELWVNGEMVERVDEDEVYSERAGPNYKEATNLGLVSEEIRSVMMEDVNKGEGVELGVVVEVKLFAGDEKLEIVKRAALEPTSVVLQEKGEAEE